MSCKRYEPLLSALSDGELDRFTAWRVRRHLARCPHCAALYADMERITTAAQALRNATATVRPSAGWSDRVQHQITESTAPAESDTSVLNPVFDTKENTMYPSNVSRRPQWGMFPTPNWSRIAVPAVVTVCTVICAIGLGLQIFTPTPRAAFADVQRAIEGIQIAHIRFQMKTGITVGKGENTPPEPMTVYDAWLRADPPSYVMTMPGGVRMVGGRTGIALQAGDGPAQQITTTPVTEADIRKALLSPEELLHNKTDNTNVEWSYPTTVTGQNGTPLLRFESNQGDTQRTLWVFPSSNRPARIEVRQTNRPPADAEDPVAIAMEFTVDFSYNETPPPGTFDVLSVSGKQRPDDSE